MNYVSEESLEKVRVQLKRCLAAKHIETDASLKKSLIEAITELDRELGRKNHQLTTCEVLRMVGTLLDKLPWIVSLFGNLK